MFAKIIHEWRNVYEGYKGSWSPPNDDDSPWAEKGGHSLPAENPDKPRTVPVDATSKRMMHMRSSSSTRKPGHDPMKAPAGTISSTQRKPAMPPPIPGAARKSPPPIPRR